MRIMKKQSMQPKVCSYLTIKICLLHLTCTNVCFFILEINQDKNDGNLLEEIGSTDQEAELSQGKH